MTISPISCTKSACSAALHLPFFSPFIHSFGDGSDNSSSSSSIVFQSLSQAEPDAASSVKETQPMRAIVSSNEGQVVCPRTMRRIPENYVPCVFLGQRAPKNGSKCLAMDWDASALLDEEPSRNSTELNNNSYIDKECQQWADKCSRRPSKEVRPQLVSKQCKTNVNFTGFSSNKT